MLALLDGGWLLQTCAIVAGLCGGILLFRCTAVENKLDLPRDTASQVLVITMMVFLATTGVRLIIVSYKLPFPGSFFWDKLPLLLVVFAALVPAWPSPRRAALPFAPARFLKGVGLGALLYLLLLPGILILHQWVMKRQKDPEAVQESLRVFGELLESGSYAVLGATALALVVLVPLYEEIIFRGLVQTGLLGVLGARIGAQVSGSAAILSTAFIFMFLHEPFTWITVFALGIVLGLLRWRTGDLWAPLAFHVCHNGVTLLLILWV